MTTSAKVGEMRAFNLLDPEEAITSVKQMEVIAEPTRYAIYSAIAWGGVTTIREISEHLAMKQASLYRHIEQLCEVGLIHEAGDVETTRRPAKSYRATKRVLRYKPDSPKSIEALCSVVDRAASHAANGFRRSAETGRAVPLGPHRDTHLGVQSGWLTKSERKRANQLINELRELLMNSGRREKTELMHLTLLMWPETKSAVS